MATTNQTTASTEDDYRHDALIDAAEEAGGSASRALFDLRTIIGGLFVLYGAYLTIRGIFDSQAAVEQAAGVRINLWTGLFALALGGGFLLWALLRPLTLEEIVEGQAESVDESREHELLREERSRPQHH
jgi:hypothetical protein